MTSWHLDSSTFPDLLPMTDRSPGIHVSNVIARLNGYDNDAPTNAQLGRMQLGCALEWATLQRIIKHTSYFIPGHELESDDIYGTFDALEFKLARLGDPSKDRIVEIKLTWMRAPPLPTKLSILNEDDKSSVVLPDSSILFDEKFFAWRTQLMSYCYMYGTALGRLIAVFVRANGECDWRDWSVNFDHVDLTINWAMIRSCAEVMQGE